MGRCDELGNVRADVYIPCEDRWLQRSKLLLQKSRNPFLRNENVYDTEISKLNYTVDGLKEMGINDAVLFTHIGLQDGAI